MDAPPRIGCTAKLLGWRARTGGLWAIAAVLVLVAGGCGGTGEHDADVAVEVVADAVATETPVDAFGDSGSQEVVDLVETSDDSAGLSCIVPIPGIGLSEDTVLCPGTYIVEDPTGEGAIVIAADGITLSCDGTHIIGSVGHATTGIGLVDKQGVTVEGCRVSGFGYGIRATNSSGLEITGCDLRGNLDEPDAGWVFDTVQGGGLRLEGVSASLIAGNLLGDNWTAVELRSCSGVEVAGNDGSHTSNAGAMLLGSHNNLIVGNDFSHAARGASPHGDGPWFGADTRDSAGILLDSSSSGNVIRSNTVSNSGNGVYLRSVLGGCPAYNSVELNYAANVANKAYENWCDYNTFVYNAAVASNYGMWLGGGDHMWVVYNVVTDNQVDGISMQVRESRHNMIYGNLVTGNGRAGLLLSGREYQEWDTLETVSEGVANASHNIVQRNLFGDNAETDIFLSATRGIVLASNCGADDGDPVTATLPDAYDVIEVGACGIEFDNSLPQVVLPAAGTQVGIPAQFSASDSWDPDEQELSFYWLAEPFATAFHGGVLPVPNLAGVGGGEAFALFWAPGVYSLAVTVSDGVGAALATTQVYVAPAGDDLAEVSAESWNTGCGGNCETTLTDDADTKVIGDTSMRADTSAPWDFWLELPAPEEGWALDTGSVLHMYMRSYNPNSGGWQGNFPRVQFRDSDGKKRFVAPTSNVLGTSQNNWVHVAVPLGGGPGWSVDDKGADLGKIARIFIHMDTYGWTAYTVWIDGCVVVP